MGFITDTDMGIQSVDMGIQSVDMGIFFFQILSQVFII